MKRALNPNNLTNNHRGLICTCGAMVHADGGGGAIGGAVGGGHGIGVAPVLGPVAGHVGAAAGGGHAVFQEEVTEAVMVVDMDTEMELIIL